MRKQLLTVFTLFLAAMSVWAQGPSWRYNRYNGFKAHKITDKTIVFFGNSITNMHEWWEAFNNPNIVNRGVNGAETPIMLEHFESILVGQPAKIFLMMGTNDLGTSGMNTPAHVAKSVRTALMRCQKESPNTKVYVQSILPCTGNNIKTPRTCPLPTTRSRTSAPSLPTPPISTFTHCCLAYPPTNIQLTAPTSPWLATASGATK